MQPPVIMKDVSPEIIVPDLKSNSIDLPVQGLVRDRSVSHTFGFAEKNNINNIYNISDSSKDNNIHPNLIGGVNRLDNSSVNESKKPRPGKTKNRYAFSPVMSHLVDVPQSNKNNNPLQMVL